MRCSLRAQRKKAKSSRKAMAPDAFRRPCPLTRERKCRACFVSLPSSQGETSMIPAGVRRIKCVPSEEPGWWFQTNFLLYLPKREILRTGLVFPRSRPQGGPGKCCLVSVRERMPGCLSLAMRTTRTRASCADALPAPRTPLARSPAARAGGCSARRWSRPRELFPRVAGR